MNEIKNTVGRPREHDRIQVGKDFVEWAKTHPDCLTVPHFSTANGYSTHRMINWCDEDPEFRQYYLEAKEFIGINRLNATRLTSENETNQGKKALDKTIYLRHVHNFDPDMKKSDREEKEYETELKKQLIDHQTQKENSKLVSPYEEIHELKHKNMMIEDELQKLKELNADKSQTE